MTGDGPLDAEDRLELLRIARTALRGWLVEGEPPIGAPHRPSLQGPLGAFVTIHVDGRLRGCLGRIEASEPLFRTVMELTIGAASRDPRFDPVRVDEVDATRIEISILSPLEPLADPGAIEIGRDGLLITRGARRGLLLPQVAVEHGWDRDTFLGETCRKAGLAPDAWRAPDTRVERFTAQVFGE